jgi:DNA-binding transcriptional MerR regulator
MYSINDVANICDLSVYTLRFYDKEGLLPFVTRNNIGNRQFSENDLEMIKLICCLKNSGMQVKDIKRYIDLFMEGDNTVSLRKQMMVDHRKSILKQINDLKKQLSIVELKIAFYDSYNGSKQC